MLTVVLGTVYVTGTVLLGCLCLIGVGMGMPVSEALLYTFAWPVYLPYGLIRNRIRGV